MKVQRSVCPFDCPDRCGLLVHIKDNRVVKVQGDPEHPFTRGALCMKMAHYEQTVHAPDRLLTPLLRTGPKGEGVFTPISWEEAVSRIVHTWNGIYTSHGAEAILPFSAGGNMGLVQRSAGHPFFHKLGASRLDRTICAPALEHGWASVMGDTPGVCPEEAGRSDFLLLWGINAVVTNHHFLIDVQAAKKQQAKVWLIDTYQTPTAKIADRTFLIRPGTDGALALGLMHVLFRDKLVDQSFLDANVLGYHELREQVLSSYSPERVSSITGLAQEEIEELALAYGKARAPFIRLGCGLSRYKNGAMTVRAITCLPALTGAWAKDGGGLLARTFVQNLFDMSKITREDFQSRPTRLLNINQLGTVLAMKENPVMSLFVYSANPAATLPDQNQVLRGLCREDLFTVVHERFMTDTAKYADIVLPATTSLEHSDIYRAAGHFMVQRAKQVIPPVGQAKSNWQVFSLLAREMGFDDPFFSQSEDEIIENILLPSATCWSAECVAALKHGTPVKIPLPSKYKTTYLTASGKIELANLHEPDVLPNYYPAYGGEEEYWFVSSPDKRLLNSSFNERVGLIKEEKMVLKMSTGDASRSSLISGQHVIAWNDNGEVLFTLEITDEVPVGIVVCEGVWWLSNVPGKRSVNALTHQRLTDQAHGSTFYDTKVYVRGV